jgi:hypothetical protein
VPEKIDAEEKSGSIRIIIITRIAIAKQWRTSPHPMSPNSSSLFLKFSKWPPFQNGCQYKIKINY